LLSTGRIISDRVPAAQRWASVRDELGFDAEEFAAMPVSDRVRVCRLLATRARNVAELSSAKLKPAYLRIAAEWDQLALDIERQD
jgi:hypothetical protein